MKTFGPSDSDQAPKRTKTPFPNLRRVTWADLRSFHWRHAWWHLLDHWETRRTLRRMSYGLLVGAVALAATFYWGYPWWEKRNAIRIAQAWLDSGHLKYAAEAAQRAALVAPERPEPWSIAAELARRGGQKDTALQYSRRAAELAPENADLTVDWAADALRADHLVETTRTLDRLPADVQAASPHVQRLRGEVARRQSQFAAARRYFAAAAQLEGPLAVNEVPLALILLESAVPADHALGLELLAKWAADADWGATALRGLLTDAFLRNDRVALRKWGGQLWLHPRHTRADIPQCLLALAQTDQARYAEVLATLEKNHAVSPAAAIQLLSWLNQIGQSAEAVRWMHTLPADAMARPPLVVAGAEALRLTADWPALEAWTRDGNWGNDVEFLRWAYGMQAAKKRGDDARADELWRTLYNHAQLNSAHALFAASNLYTWGLLKEAEALWWRAAEQEGPNAIEALGALARYYQTQRDAEGQYRVFRQLHLLKPADPAIGNNYAFFAALTGREPRLAEQAARANLDREPQNPVYLATLAFTLFQQNRTEEALGLLRPRAPEAARSPALGFAYGLALAAAGRTAEARPLLNALRPESLTIQEIQLIQATLKN